MIEDDEISVSSLQSEEENVPKPKEIDEEMRNNDDDDESFINDEEDEEASMVSGDEDEDDDYMDVEEGEFDGMPESNENSDAENDLLGESENEDSEEEDSDDDDDDEFQKMDLLDKQNIYHSIIRSCCIIITRKLRHYPKLFAMKMV